MSSDHPSPSDKRPSLTDYVVRYDLATMLREMQLDFGETAAGAPRLLGQKDISARFRIKPRPTEGKEAE